MFHGKSPQEVSEKKVCFELLGSVQGTWAMRHHLGRGDPWATWAMGICGVSPSPWRIHGAGIYANMTGYIDGKCYHIWHTWILWDQTSKDLSDTNKKKSCRLRSWTVVYRFSDLESRISTLESQISDLESRFLNFDSRILNLESRTSNLCSRISDLESPFSNLESRVRCQVHSELLTGTSEFWRTTSSSRSHSATPPCLK